MHTQHTGDDVANCLRILQIITFHSLCIENNHNNYNYNNNNNNRNHNHDGIAIISYKKSNHLKH